LEEGFNFFWTKGFGVPNQRKPKREGLIGEGSFLNWRKNFNLIKVGGRRDWNLERF